MTVPYKTLFFIVEGLGEIPGLSATSINSSYQILNLHVLQSTKEYICTEQT